MGEDERALRVRLLGEAVRDGSGRIVAMQGAAQDITEAHAAAQQLQRLENRAPGAGAPAARGAEDGVDRHAGRRHRARLQQHPAGDPGQRRAGARRPAELPRTHTALQSLDQINARGAARAQPGAADPDLQPPPAAARCSRSRCARWSRKRWRCCARRCRRGVELRRAAGRRAAGRRGRRHPAAAGADEPVHQRLARAARQARAASRSGSQALRLAAGARGARPGRPGTPGPASTCGCATTAAAWTTATLQRIFDPFFTTKAVGPGHRPRPVGGARHRARAPAARSRSTASPARAARFHVYLPRQALPEAAGRRRRR